MLLRAQELLLERQKLVEDIRESEKNVKPAIEAVIERKALIGMEVRLRTCHRACAACAHASYTTCHHTADACTATIVHKNRRKPID